MMSDLNIASHHSKLVYGQFVALEEGGYLKPMSTVKTGE